MRRTHLFEFCDLSITPDWLRGYVLDLLQFQSFTLYKCIAPDLMRWLHAQDIRNIVDVASGAGGPWPGLIRQFAQIGLELRVQLSDLYPGQLDRLPSQLSWHPASVSLTEPFGADGSPRSFFTCLHHLQPNQVAELLAGAQETGSPVFIAEFTQRRWSAVAGMLLSPLLVALQTPFLRPLKIGRLFWTYVIPVVPIIYMWDGAVSHLRSYRLDELRSTIAELPLAAYRWEAGERTHPAGGGRVTYVLGFALQQAAFTASISSDNA